MNQVEFDATKRFHSLTRYDRSRIDRISTTPAHALGDRMLAGPDVPAPSLNPVLKRGEEGNGAWLESHLQNAQVPKRRLSR